MMGTHSQMHRKNKYSQHSSIIWSVWLNGWVFVYQLSGCEFESRCCHLNFRYRAYFEQGVPWHSGQLKSVYSLWNIQTVLINDLGLHNVFKDELSSLRKCLVFHFSFFISSSKLFLISRYLHFCLDFLVI